MQYVYNTIKQASEACQRMRWQSHWQTLRELSEDKWLYALGHSFASVSYIAIDKEFNRSLAGLAGNEAVGRRRDTRRGKKERRRRLTRARKLQLIQRVNNWAALRGEGLDDLGGLARPPARTFLRETHKTTSYTVDDIDSVLQVRYTVCVHVLVCFPRTNNADHLPIPICITRDLIDTDYI